ncbi:MAG: HNH endonuclease [Fusobacteriaceae bacterium]
MDFTINIFDKQEYYKVLNETLCFDKKTRKLYYNSSNYSLAFYKKLLKLSNYHCFYCGEKLHSNHPEGIYFEREHIIDKKIYPEDSDEYKVLLHCKKNLIPICKNCNSIKTFRDKKNVKNLIPKKCSELERCLNIEEIAQTYNFCFVENLHFDFLNLQFFSAADEEKIRNLKLNNRNQLYFDTLFELLYNVNIYLPKDKRNVIFSKIVKNKVEENMIEFIEDFNLLNTEKLKNLIETITLLSLH